MNQHAPDFDPQQILQEHKQFFEANRNTFSPMPKRFITPNESVERSFKGGSGDYREFVPAATFEPLASENNPNGFYNEEQETLEKNKELLIMTIEIGDGNRDTLRVFEDDDPYELAKVFCEAHNLSSQIIEPLAQNIFANIAKVLEERAQGVNEEFNNEIQEGEILLQKKEQGGSFNIPDHNESEIFKDVGVKTGEFKGLQDQQQHHELEYNQQNPSKYYYSEAQRFHERGGLSEFGQNSQQYQSIGHSYPNDELAGKSWEDQAMNYRQNEFAIRPSHVEPQKGRGQKQETHPSPPREELRKNTKSTEVSQRMSYIEYPSENRYHHPESSFPEHFQSEEEYLEFLITNQYGGKRQNLWNVKNPSSELTFTPQINRSSRAMLESKYQNSKVNVYDRLHNHAKIRNQRLSSNNNLSSPRKSTGASGRRSVNSNQSDINYGCLLYHRGVKKKEEVSKILNDVKKEMVMQQERECTFKPNINQISTEIVNSKPKFDRTEDSLIQYGRILKEKTERARSAQKDRETEGCTFKPSINRMSAKIIQAKERITHDPIKDKFTKLYCDSKIRQAQQEIRASIFQDECTFTPAINEYSGQIVDQTNFEQRNKRFSARLNHIESLRRQKEELELFDPQTGQLLFKPVVGRPPRDGSRERNVQIGDHLYNRRFEKENIQRDLFEKEQRSIEAKQVRSSEKSHLIMENIQKKKLKEIFRALDSDEDGYISSSKIDITTVGTDVLEAFAPLLCEMEELNHMLSQNEFIEAAEKLLKTLPIHEKDKLLLQKKSAGRKSVNEEYPFHPEINRKSARIAQNRRPYGNFDALYEQYVGERKATEVKIKYEQDKKKKDELKECSFKPSLMSEANLPISAMNNIQYYYNDRFV